MKIQIDTQNKTVEVLEINVNLSDLVKALKMMLGEEYKEYSLVHTPSYTYVPYYPWTTPIIYDPYKPILTWTTSASTSDTYVYNLEIVTEPNKN